MKELKYSPDAVEKLHTIKKEIAERYGENVACRVLKRMTQSFRYLQYFEKKGQSVEKIFGIISEYRFLYAEHNYAFYRITEDSILIVDIYNEREDFMWKLFGIKTTSAETEEYWGE